MFHVDGFLKKKKRKNLKKFGVCTRQLQGIPLPCLQVPFSHLRVITVLHSLFMLILLAFLSLMNIQVPSHLKLLFYIKNILLSFLVAHMGWWYSVSSFVRNTMSLFFWATCWLYRDFWVGRLRSFSTIKTLAHIL